MKVYRGIRGEPCCVRVVEVRPIEPGNHTANGDHPGENGEEGERFYDLPPRPDLFVKPPRPFDWGSDAPGTWHLAAALLADRGGDPKTMRALVPYFRRLLSRLPPDGFEVSDTFLDAIAYAIAGGRAPGTPANSTATPPPAKEAAVASEAPESEETARNRAREIDPAT